MEVAPRFTLLTLLFTLFTVELLSKIREWMKRLDGLDTGPILLRLLEHQQVERKYNIIKTSDYKIQITKTDQGDGK